MPPETMNQMPVLTGLFRSCVSRFKKSGSKSKSGKRTLQEGYQQNDNAGFPRDRNASSLSAHEVCDGERIPVRDPESNNNATHQQQRSRIDLNPNIETGIIKVERDGQKVAAIVLNQSMAMDWNAILIYRSKISRYTKELRGIDTNISQLEENKAKALKEGDEFAETQQATMQIADIINTDTIQRVRAEIDDLECGLGEFQERKRKFVRKLTRAQDMFHLSLSRLETTIRRLFEENDLLDDAATSDDSDAISQTPLSPSFSPGFHGPLPVLVKASSPTPTEIERRKTRQNIWDLSERVETLEDRLSDWPNYRSDRLKSYIQALEEGETSDTQTVFDLKLLKERQDTTRKLIDAEEEYTKTEAHAREIGVFIDDGEQEEGFDDYDDDGYTISHEKEMADESQLDWIYGWMEETPENDAEPDVVRVGETALDDWNVREVQIEDSVSVRDIFVSVGRRRERIDAYREVCEDLKVSRT